jgi:hypothetical protein
VLKDKDAVFIRQIPGLQDQHLVTITGEVKFPGPYSLSQVNERLSHLIERSGGLTEHAFLEGCRFTRQWGEERKRVAVDMEEVLSGKIEHDLILKEGDEVLIPPRDWVVEVQGAVQRPQLIQYVPNKKAIYYVDLVGGFLSDADVNAAYIVRANQFVLKANKRFGFDPVVPPGSMLVIPSKVAPRNSLWKRHGMGFIGGALVAGLILYWVD